MHQLERLPRRTSRRRQSGYPTVASALLLAAACADPLQPPAPAAAARPQLAAAAKTTATIAGVTGATTFEIDGATKAVTVSVTNAGRSALKDVAVAAAITQGTASHAAGRALVTCANSAPGVLPKGATCETILNVAASNAGAGSGTLAPGDASLETTLVQGSGRRESVLDGRSTAISLTAQQVPGDPSITSLALPVSEFLVNGPGHPYTITLDNPGTALSIVVVQGEIVQGDVTHAAGGTNVLCSPLPGGTLPTGTCSFDWSASASNLSGGSGTFTAGPATLLVTLVHNSQTLDSWSEQITIVEPSDAYLANVTPAAWEFIIGGNAVSSSILIRNPTQATYGSVNLHARIRQGSAVRQAGGGGQVNCGSSRGQLPPGDCLESLSITASNATGGDGTLAPGAAVLEIELTRSGDTLSIVSLPIMLKF